MEENGVMCEANLQVLEHEGSDIGLLEFESAFENSLVVGRCIMMSQPLHDAFAELYDLPSAATVTIQMSNEDRRGHFDQARCLTLSAASESGSCDIDFAASSSAFIEFSCASSTEAECSASFHVAVLQQAFKALAYSNETFLRLNADGFLSVQHMIESGTGQRAFVDALICPEESSIP